MGFSHLARKGVTIEVVLKGDPPSSRVEGRWGETGELSPELGLKGKAAGGWKGDIPGGEAAESRRRAGNELASCQVGGTGRHRVSEPCQERRVGTGPQGM